MVRAELLRAWGGPLPSAGRLPKHYPLEVASPRTVCEACGGRLRRQRSATRYPLGVMLGQPRVRLIEKQCVGCRKVYRAEAYYELVPPRGNYAFDLIVAVGLARFREHRQNGEIQAELQARWGLWLPCSTIGELAHAFLDGLAAAHQAKAAQLRQRLEEDGGYALHVDGTCEPGTEIVFNTIAGNRGWSLTGAKMAAEDATQIATVLRRCAEWFGTPLALMRDLSPQIQIAKKEVLPKVPDLVCHYHFLENVGSKLCEKPHAKLTACLRRLKIQAALRHVRKDQVRYSKQKARLSAEEIEGLLRWPQTMTGLEPLQVRRAVTYLALRWLEDYGADLEGEYFPFDLPSLAFYRRGRQLYDWLAELTAAADFPSQGFSTLATITRHLAPLQEDAELTAAAERLEQAAALFEEVRGVLRLDSDPRSVPCCPPVPADALTATEAVEQSLRPWTDRLRQRLAAEDDDDRAADLQTVLGYLEKYHDHLVGHVITRKGREGAFVVARTNNFSEHRFARAKQGLRRKLGTKKLARSIQAMRAEELLVANLDDPQYVEILCGGTLENLPATFAHHWQAGQAIRAERRQRTSTHPIPTRKKVLREKAFLPRLKEAIAVVIQRIRDQRCAA